MFSPAFRLGAGCSLQVAAVKEPRHWAPVSKTSDNEHIGGGAGPLKELSVQNR